MPAGTLYPYTGYEMTFADFQRLLSDADYRPSVAPLLREWFGYEVEASGDDVRILSREGAAVDALSAHRSIQEDSSRQYTLYQTAMTLWR